MRLNQRKSLGAFAAAGTILGLASWAGAQDRTLDPATQAAVDRIFGPLGMAHTHFHDDRNELVVNRAAGYAPKEGGGYEISMTKLDLVGDGGVSTTIDDLAR
jgi:CubicO group peptidase (beta-lactamase class C family)